MRGPTCRAGSSSSFPRPEPRREGRKRDVGSVSRLCTHLNSVRADRPDCGRARRNESAGLAYDLKVTDQGLFTAFMREERPLSVHLRTRREVRSLLERVRRATTEDELDAFRGSELLKEVNAIRPTAPAVGPLGLGRIDEGEGEWRAVGEGRQIPTVRYYARYKTDGDVELLEFWPNDEDSDLKTVDDELMDKIGGYGNLGHCAREDVTEYWRLSTTWKLGLVDERGPWALYTYVDLTKDEEQAHAKNGTMSDVLKARHERMASIVAAIAAQTDRFFDRDLPGEIEALVADRSAVIADRAAIVASLGLPEEDWAGGQDADEEVASAATVETSAGATDLTAMRGRSADTAVTTESNEVNARASDDSRHQIDVATRGQPHWLVVALVGTVLALILGLVITWLGLNDWRFRFVEDPARPNDRELPVEDSTSPAPVTELS